MRKGLFGLTLICGVQFASAQMDKHFSMFFANPVQLNPGSAGHGDGDIGVFTNYRSQWFSISDNPFRSFSASVDGRLFEQNLNNGFFGAGINFYHDQTGDSQYQQNIVSFPINYSLEVNKYSYLALGVQPAYFAQSIDKNALYFDSQWDGGGFNQAISSGENLGLQNFSRFDLSTGLYYISKPSKNLSYKGGVALNHITKQKVSFYSINEKLYRNATFFAQVSFKKENSKITFHPAAFWFFQGPNRELTIGNNFEFQLKPPSIHTMYFNGQSISLGVYYRTSDAFITNVIYNAGALSFGIGYDLNLSDLTVATGGSGAFELFLSFRPEFGPGFGGAPRIN
jgi:type IX secretion system PorP/SprF family membrane protein